MYIIPNKSSDEAKRKLNNGELNNSTIPMLYVSFTLILLRETYDSPPHSTKCYDLRQEFLDFPC